MCEIFKPKLVTNFTKKLHRMFDRVLNPPPLLWEKFRYFLYIRPRYQDPKKYKNCSSTTKIKEYRKKKDLCFQESRSFLNEMRNLHTDRVTVIDRDIPTKIIKQNEVIISCFIPSNFNALHRSNFAFKKNATPTFKTHD